MKVELIYNLKAGVRAADVDLKLAPGMPTRKAQRNPDGTTVLQLYNNWFNVKVVLVEADGTKVVKDYSEPDFLNYFTTKFNWKGTIKAEESSFLFQYSRKFGEMHIKVADTSFGERPVIIVRGHKASGNTSAPRMFDLDLYKPVKLPFAGDRVDDFFDNSTATYGTTIHFLDLNEEVAPGQSQWLEEENLKKFETKLALLMAYKKHAYLQRDDDYANKFHERGAPLEAEMLNQRDCEATLLEITNNDHYPERVNAFVTTAIIDRLEEFIKKAANGTAVGIAISKLDRTSAIAAIRAKVQQLENSPVSVASVKSKSSDSEHNSLPAPDQLTEAMSKAVFLIAEEPYLARSPEPVAIDNVPNVQIVEDDSLDDTLAILTSADNPDLSGFSEEEFSLEQLMKSPEQRFNPLGIDLDDVLGSFEEESPQDLLSSLDVGFNPDDLLDGGLDGLGGPSEPKRARVIGEY